MSAAAASRALDGFDAEVDAMAVVPLPQPPEPQSLLGPLVASLLFGGYLVTGAVDAQNRWFEPGAALSARILAGETYRTVTALTLHAHFAHVFGNAVVAFVLLGAVGQALGPGVAALLTLLAGASGNWATAQWYGPGHASLGASTAIFGALGLLTVPGSWRRTSGWPAWVAVGASPSRCWACWDRAGNPTSWRTCLAGWPAQFSGCAWGGFRPFGPGQFDWGSRRWPGR